MNMNPVPYMMSEVEYRQQRVRDMYPRTSRVRRRRVPRRPHLSLPRLRRRRPVAVA